MATSGHNSANSQGKKSSTAHGRAHLRVGSRGPVPQAVALTALLLGAGCGADGGELPEVERADFAATVSEYVFSSCTTSVVLGLSTQIAEEVNCMNPGTLVSFSEGGGIDFTGSAVLPWIAPAAQADLLAAVSGGGTVQVNSAYRTVAQQYLLYRWWQEGRCGITAAATPGNSNHETGRALDVNNYSSWVGTLGAHGWSHTVPGDPVHFDHLGSPDLRGADVLAFQRLWNRNHPGDVIAEDGDYGPQTASKLAASPAGGFATGACPTEPPPPPTPAYAARTGASGIPAEATSGERIVVWVELQNDGSATWLKDTTRLGTTQPRDRASAFYDPENWIAPHRASGVDHDTAPGAVGRFSFIVNVPVVATDTVVSETFGLVEEGVTWFGPEDVTIELLVHPAAPAVVPDPSTPADPAVDDVTPGGDPTGAGAWSGGCSVGESAARRGGASAAGGFALLALLALLAVRRRGRRA